MDDNEKNEFMFTQLVLMFHAAALQQMGKMHNPLTGKIERDLNAAQGSIDLLDMLKVKCKGNLSANEEKILSQVLTEVKLNFVDERNKPEESTAEADKKPPEGGSGTT